MVNNYILFYILIVSIDLNLKKLIIGNYLKVMILVREGTEMPIL